MIEADAFGLLLNDVLEAIVHKVCRHSLKVFGVVEGEAGIQLLLLCTVADFRLLLEAVLELGGKEFYGRSSLWINEVLVACS